MGCGIAVVVKALQVKEKNERVGRVGIIMDRRLVLTLLEELSQAGARAEQETRRGIP